VLCTGMTGCSPNQRESNPSASAFCATTAASRGCRPENSEIPMFIITSLSILLGQYGTCAACQFYQVFKHRGVDYFPEECLQQCRVTLELCG
jgi:hypothetical protein